MPASNDSYCLFYEGWWMMEGVRQYILSLITAAIVCSIVKRIVGADSSFAPLLRIICGVFIAAIMLSPWIDFDLNNFPLVDGAIYQDANAVSDLGKAAADEALQAIIKEQTETYILSKANSLGIEISVDVTLSDGNLPSSVVICGEISPYSKTALGQYIEDTLAIPEEEQQWM